MISGIFVLLFGLAALPSVTAAQPERPNYAIIITIDGCRPDKLLEASTLNVDNLVAGAAYAWDAQTVYPSKTPPTHASLFTGAYPETHGYYEPGDTLRVETIFQVFEAAGKQTALIDGKGGRIAGLEVGVRYVKNDVDYRWLPGATEWQPGSEDLYGDLRVMENTIRIFVENRPVLTFVLLPQVDTAGHIYGHESTEYLRAIEKADRAVGMLVDNLKGLGVYEDTLLVILSDHGMTGRDHGWDPEDVIIPVIFVGPGVVEGELSDVKIIDVSPTVTALFGLRAPAGSEGRNLFGEMGIRVELVLVAVAAAAVVIVAVGIFVKKRAREVAPPTQPPLEAR